MSIKLIKTISKNWFISYFIIINLSQIIHFTGRQRTNFYIEIEVSNINNIVYVI